MGAMEERKNKRCPVTLRAKILSEGRAFEGLISDVSEEVTKLDKALGKSFDRLVIGMILTRPFICLIWVLPVWCMMVPAE